MKVDLKKPCFERDSAGAISRQSSKCFEKDLLSEVPRIFIGLDARSQIMINILRIALVEDPKRSRIRLTSSSKALLGGDEMGHFIIIKWRVSIGNRALRAA